MSIFMSDVRKNDFKKGIKIKYLLEIMSKIFINKKEKKGEILLKSYSKITLWKNIDLWINIFDMIYNEMLEIKKKEKKKDNNFF